MKWIKNFLIATVAALSMSGVCANEISVDEISHAARVSADPVDITNVNLFDIGSNDQSMIYAYYIWPEAFKSGLGKVALDGKSFKPENMPNNGSGVGFILMFLLLSCPCLLVLSCWLHCASTYIESHLAVKMISGREL